MRDLLALLETMNKSGPTSLADVAEHFLTTRDDLLDDDEHEDLEWSLEHDQKFVLEIIGREYVSGTCGAFAVALHDKLGFPIVKINGSLHIAVRAPDGEIVDFMGKNPLAKVLRRYKWGKKTSVEVISREQCVAHVLMDEQESDDPWDEIAVAKFVIQTIGRW